MSYKPEGEPQREESQSFDTPDENNNTEDTLHPTQQVELHTNATIQRIASELRQMRPDWDAVYDVLRGGPAYAKSVSLNSFSHIADGDFLEAWVRLALEQIVDKLIQEGTGNVYLGLGIDEGTETTHFRFLMRLGRWLVERHDGTTSAEYDDVIDFQADDPNENVLTIVEVKGGKVRYSTRNNGSPNQAMSDTHIRRVTTPLQELGQENEDAGISGLGYMLVVLIDTKIKPSLTFNFVDRGGILVKLPISYESLIIASQRGRDLFEEELGWWRTGGIQIPPLEDLPDEEE